jgi:Family of unknown function (DUF6304)
MTTTCAARYRDQFGEERTTLLNDGRLLSLTIRGVRFTGYDFDSFEPQAGSDPVQLASFSFRNGSLCQCVMEADIPISVATPGGIVIGLLSFELQLGEPLSTGQMNPDRLALRLQVNDQTFVSEGKTGWFEGEIRSLQSRLPPGTSMNVCFNCAYSDYSPYGHGLFGDMICFRTNKEGYLRLPAGENFEKDPYFDLMKTVWDTDPVQEIHLCPEFEQRLPGTGYRG